MQMLLNVRFEIVLFKMMNGCWKACIEPDTESGSLFAADAIISNPPAFAHVHCAEALGIPLTLSFSMLNRLFRTLELSKKP